MNLLLKNIFEFAGEIYSSSRWTNPDYPGSAKIESVAERTGDPDSLLGFRETESGAYLLTVMDSFEEALNDDWMPSEICGLPLEAARKFIHTVWNELQSSDPEAAVLKLKEQYKQLLLQ